jgi:hypothetical protein
MTVKNILIAKQILFPGLYRLQEENQKGKIQT